MISNRARALALMLAFSASGFVAARAEAPASRASKPAPAAETGSNVGVTPKGGGLFIKSGDGRAVVRSMGYAQPTVIATAESNKQAYQAPSFFVRRRRRWALPADFARAVPDQALGRLRKFRVASGRPGKRSEFARIGR